MRQLRSIRVVVYRVTGKQLFFTVPDRVCEECDLTVAIARRAVDKAGPGIAELTVKPWLNAFFEALLKGGWHPPVVTVEGRIVSQGVVPQQKAVEEAILEARNALTVSPQ
ncbi:MAG: hypothetical protein HYY02_12985 [Chloroflexi bacterium]|nr:hypothetical protein [Chloroflexota bacterium]